MSDDFMMAGLIVGFLGAGLRIAALHSSRIPSKPWLRCMSLWYTQVCKLVGSKFFHLLLSFPAVQSLKRQRKPLFDPYSVKALENYIGEPITVLQSYGCLV